eukprot:TRINITY_DN9535_c0_g1_i1.p2 TRINITY_DN9535_c0_g1~~TRINITY_DN9535_c0_g1_i1.p2  ORF type:complete len:290 (-),score=-25.36 TRINITY_DN9535_c0_g1_i1:281-1150(-)
MFKNNQLQFYLNTLIHNLVFKKIINHLIIKRFFFNLHFWRKQIFINIYQSITQLQLLQNQFQFQIKLDQARFSVIISYSRSSFSIFTIKYKLLKKFKKYQQVLITFAIFMQIVRWGKSLQIRINTKLLLIILLFMPFFIYFNQVQYQNSIFLYCSLVFQVEILQPIIAERKIIFLCMINVFQKVFTSLSHSFSIIIVTIIAYQLLINEIIIFMHPGVMGSQNMCLFCTFTLSNIQIETRVKFVRYTYVKQINNNVTFFLFKIIKSCYICVCVYQKKITNYVTCVFINSY